MGYFNIRAGRYYRHTGISRYSISVIHIVIQFGHIFKSIYSKHKLLEFVIALEAI